MVTVKLELANSFTRRVCNDIIVDYNVFSLTYLYVYLDQQGAEMLEMQQIPSPRIRLFTTFSIWSTDKQQHK